MRKLLIAVLIVCLILVGAGIGLAIWARIQVKKALPQISGQITARGLTEAVEIYRDEYGIPHIYAANREDLMFAVGYVSAQERLWQMDLSRRAATGHLAEIFGEKAIAADLLMRTIGVKRVAMKQFENLSPETSDLLEAYSDGVNACIEKIETLPPEFRILGYNPEKWSPTDSLAISRLLGWQLSKNYKSEIIMMKLIKRLGVEKAAELDPTYPAEGPFIIPEGEFEGTYDIIESTPLEEGGEILDQLIGTTGGSNSWVIGASLTESGYPILANDPHLSGTRMPSLWYYVHLVGGGFDVIGGIVPGTPLPILGHNRSIGWGMTNMTTDVQDVYLERINPDNPNQYQYDGEWLDMEIRTERIFFRDEKGEQKSIQFNIRSTVHGPIMNEVAPGVTKAISLAWTGLEPTPDFEAMVDINLADNWNEFCQALSSFSVAPQNFIYADIYGNIGYYGAGIVPIRSEGCGTKPLPGWTSKTIWNGNIPFEELPHMFNPAADYIVTANNRIVGDDYKYFLSDYWAPSYRYRRISELIEGEKEHNFASVARMHMDSKSLLAELLLPNLMPALIDLSDPDCREAVYHLNAWDYDNTTDSIAATIYHELLLKLAENTFIDDMRRNLTGEYLGEYYLWIERFVGFVQEDSHWFDNRRTEEIETRDDIARKSLKEAIESLRERFGDDMSKWRWGDVHKVEFRHPLDRNKILKKVFNYGPFPFAGDGESINRATFDYNNPYDVAMAASLRHIMDFERLDKTLAIHTTGQSANPASEHYREFADKWLNGEYIVMMMDREDYESGVEGHLRLAPIGYTTTNRKEAQR